MRTNRPVRSALFLLVLTLVVASGCRQAEPESVAPAVRPPVIVISIDTLRADHLPAWGYDKVETPAIDRLRSDAILYRNAWSNVPLTLPSHVSVLTGLLPYEHGVRDNVGFRYDPTKHPAVTQALRAEGYETGASVSAYVLRASTGLGGAFNFYDDAITERTGTAIGNLQRPGSSSLASATKWIAQQQDRPFFLFLHFFEPHTPYDPPEPFRSRYVDRPYDGEIAASDALLGELFAFLDERGLYRKSAIILISDHGEGLGDHGETEHGALLYREALHVPLLVKLPDNERAGSEVTRNVQLTDIAPTVAEIAGTSFAGTPHARSLLSTDETAPAVYAETMYPRLHFGWSDLRSLIEGSLHFIEAPSVELYDMATDPGERTNVASERRRDLARLTQALGQHPRVDAVPAVVSPEEAKKFAALGYVGSGGSDTGPIGANPRDRIEEIEALRQGMALESEASPEELIRFYSAVLEKNPDSVDLRGHLASAYERAGRLKEAEHQYIEALGRKPFAYEGVAIALAELQLKMGKLDEAERHATLAMDRSPVHARRLLARVAGARRDYDAAERALGDPAADPSLRSYVELAQIRANQGRIPEAVSLLETARANAGDRGINVELLYFALGDIYARTGRLQDAEIAFREEIRAFPRNIHAWSRLALVLDAEGKRDELPLLFSEMTRLNPTPQARALAESTRARIQGQSARP